MLNFAKKRQSMKYSFIVPVFNRPDEVRELLDSLTKQTMQGFEVIIVEDGSTNTCKDVCEEFADTLDIHYYYKENSGPGQSRNYGAERAQGEWLIVLDSDVVLPPDYLNNVKCLNSKLSAWGGPDAAHPDFTPVQKAISYSMTSFFTTGGIRGGKTKLDKFFPRSYNMGIRREVYLQLGGFSKTSTSRIASWRRATRQPSFQKHGCGTSGAPTSASSFVRCSTVALRAST